MKKGIKPISLICLLAVALAVALAVFVYAEPATEATLTVTPDGSAATTYSGSYDEMVEKLNSLAPAATATAYELELLADAKGTKAINLQGSGNETVIIKLSGNTLELTLSAANTVSGVASFTVDGGYNYYVEVGAVSSNTAFLVVEPNESIESEINLIDLSVVSEGSILINGAIGEVMLRNVDATMLGAKEPFAAVDNALADVTLIKSSIIANGGTEQLSLTALASGAVVRLEKSNLEADFAYELRSGGSATVIDTRLYGKSAVFLAADELTDEVINMGGVSLAGGGCSSGNITKDNLHVWYGTGSTAISLFGDDVALNSALTLKSTRSQFVLMNNCWTLQPTTTSAIYTIFPDGETPTEETGSTAVKALVAVASEAQEKKTAFTVALCADYTDTSTSSRNVITSTAGNGNLSFFFDLNGHNYTKSGKTGSLLRMTGSYRFYLDGEDALGTRGSLTSDAYNAQIIYNKGSTFDSYIFLDNVNVVATNASGDGTAGGSPLLQILSSRVYAEDSRFLYTGEKYGLNVADTSLLVPNKYSYYAFQLQAGAFLTAEGCDILNTSGLEMKDTGVGVQASESGISVAHIKECTVSGFEKAISVVGNRSYFASSTVSSRGIPYYTGTSSTYLPELHITDNKTTIVDSTLSNGTVYFHYGKGLSTVTTSAAKLTGSHVCEDGYGFVSTVSGEYFIESSAELTTVKLPKVMSDGMVLQANKPVNIFGTCETVGQRITVTIGDKSVECTVDENGKWCAAFPPMPYAKGLSVYIKEGDLKYGTTRIDNVDIGEVWVMSGQSNSVYGTYKLEDLEEYVALADTYNNIRAFGVASSTKMTPREDNVTAEWYQVTSQTIADSKRADSSGTGISAIAYVMATRLAVELPDNATVAIIDINYNGSTVEAWTSLENLATTGAAEYDLYMLYYNFYIENGKYPTAADLGISESDYITESKIYQKMSCSCYNAMVAPLKNFAAAGVIWYQGEGNGSGVTADGDSGYGDLFRAVRKTFRDTFNDDELPTFIVQLSPYNVDRSYMRELQYQLALEDENTHLIFSSTAGPVFSEKDMPYTDPDDSMVHYARKSPLGLAAADSVLEHVYGMGKLSAPEIVSVKRDGYKIVVTFDREITLAFGSEIEGFELLTDDGEWVSAKGSFRSDCELEFFAAGELNPTAVRYGHGKNLLMFEDGSTVKFSFDKKEGTSNYYGYDSTTGTVTLTTEIGVIVIDVKDTPVITSRTAGNIIAANGNSLTPFSLYAE